MDSGPYTSGIQPSGWVDQESNREYNKLRQLAVLKLVGENVPLGNGSGLEKKIEDIFWRMNAIELEEYIGMRDKDKRRAPAAPAPQPVVAVTQVTVMESLARIEREIARIQKKLGMKQIYS